MNAQGSSKHKIIDVHLPVFGEPYDRFYDAGASWSSRDLGRECGLSEKYEGNEYKLTGVL